MDLQLLDKEMVLMELAVEVEVLYRQAVQAVQAVTEEMEELMERKLEEAAVVQEETDMTEQQQEETEESEWRIQSQVPLFIMLGAVEEEVMV